MNTTPITNGTNFLEYQTSAKTITSPNSSFSGAVLAKEKNMEQDSIEECKQYVCDWISSMQGSAMSSGNDVYIFITDECYYAMQQDPVYKEWVLSKIQSTFLSRSPYGHETFTCMKFGATKEDFKSESITSPTSQERKRLRENYQQEKEMQKKKLQKLRQKKQLEKHWQEQAFCKELVTLRQLDHKEQVQEENEAIRFHKKYRYRNNECALQAAAKRKVSAYEARFHY